MNLKRRLAALSLPLLIAACGDSITEAGRQAPVDLSQDWQIATPASQGIDPEELRRALGYAQSLPRIKSLLVTRHGRLVLEEYFNGTTPDELNDVRSVTKTVVSTLVGVAIQQGFLSSVDVPIGDYLNEYYDDLDPVLASITIRDLLTMSGGFQWDESTNLGYNQWILSGSPIGYLLDKPIVDTPGTTFNYNSAAVHLLSVVLQLVTNIRLPDFADEHLFGPLGFKGSRWEVMVDGWVNGGSGIDLRPRDLAKLGALWLQGGVSGDRRFLPETWVAAGTSPAYPWWQATAPLPEENYGYLWWLARGMPSGPAFLAWGLGGQYVYVAPGRDVVIVVTHDWRGAGADTPRLAADGLDLIVNHVMRAVL